MTHHLRLRPLLRDTSSLSVSLPSSENATFYFTRAPHLLSHQYPTFRPHRAIISFYAGKFSLSDDGRALSIRINGQLIGSATIQLISGDIVEVGRPRGAPHDPALAARIDTTVTYSCDVLAGHSFPNSQVAPYTLRLAHRRCTPHKSRSHPCVFSTPQSTSAPSRLPALSHFSVASHPPSTYTSSDSISDVSLPERVTTSLPYGDLLKQLRSRMDKLVRADSANASTSRHDLDAWAIRSVRSSAQFSSTSIELAMRRVREAWLDMRTLIASSASAVGGRPSAPRSLIVPSTLSLHARSTPPSPTPLTSPTTSVPTSVLRSATSSFTSMTSGSASKSSSPGSSSAGSFHGSGKYRSSDIQLPCTCWSIEGTCRHPITSASIATARIQQAWLQARTALFRFVSPVHVETCSIRTAPSTHSRVVSDVFAPAASVELPSSTPAAHLAASLQHPSLASIAQPFLSSQVLSSLHTLRAT
ncbi:hypothetical protein CF319_g8989 [Tilletia indica]|nr:hypothetical protein CF319_g8989 [Tilletia indica]